MNLAEYRVRRVVVEQIVREFEFIVPGCAQCKHFDFGKCALNEGAPIPNEFIAQREQCESWEHDNVPF